MYDHANMAVARNLCAGGGGGGGKPEARRWRQSVGGVWGHAAPENFEI